MKPGNGQALAALLLGIFLAVSLILLIRTNRSLRSEVAGLREATDRLALDNRQLQALVATRRKENTGLQDDLARWQAESEQVRRRLTETGKKLRLAAQARERVIQNKKGTAPLLPGMIAPEALRNVGQATPAATAQTLAWARKGEKIDELARIIALDPADQESLRAAFDCLGEEIRLRLGSSERLAAELLVMTYLRTSLAPGECPLQILPDVATRADATFVPYRLQLSNGDIRSNRWHLRKFPDGWRWVLPSDEVQMMVTTLANLPPSQWQYFGR